MAENIVWILRKTGPGSQPEQIPRDQVPAGYVLAALHGHGPCYIDPKSLTVNTEPHHPEFPQAVKDRLKRIRDVLIRARPLSLEKWEHGFRCDLHPWSEIAAWELLADAYAKFTAAFRGATPRVRAARQAVFNFLLDLINRDNEGRMPPHQHPGKLAVGTDGMDQIQAWFDSPANRLLTATRRNELRKLIRPAAGGGPGRVEIDALFDEIGTGMNLAAEFQPRELLEIADVILGVDRDSEHEFLLYGRELLERVAESADPEPAATIRIEMDIDTDDLERAVALVEVVKGRCDYQPSRAA